jgi:methionyl-tRNA formyltransferase/serine acetyltransferase
MSGYTGAINANAPIAGPTRVAVAGEQAAAVACLAYLLPREDTLVCAVIVSTPEGESGLGPLAEEAGILLLKGELNEHAATLSGLDLDFIFAFQHRRSLDPAVRASASRGCVNLHLGKLPRYAGWYPIVWTLLNGEPEAGVTLHTMRGEVHSGPIYAQASVPIGPGCTAAELFDRLVTRGTELFREVYPLLRTGAIRPVAQDLGHRTYYGPDSLDLEQDGVVDWNDEYEALDRRIRAFSFAPYHDASTWLRLPGGATERVSIGGVTSMILKKRSASAAGGQVLEVLADGALLVETRDGHGVRIGSLAGRNPRAYLQAKGVAARELRFLSTSAAPTAETPEGLTSRTPRIGPYCSISEDVKLGAGVLVQGYTQLSGCTIGEGTALGAYVEIQRGARLGRDIRVQSNTFICGGVTLEDGVFVGHHVTFMNERYPTAEKMGDRARWSFDTTRVGRGASIGSGAVIFCGITIGEGAVIGAGSVVTASVAPHTVVAGSPARKIRGIAPEERFQGGARMPATTGETPS